MSPTSYQLLHPTVFVCTMYGIIGDFQIFIE